MNKYLQRYAVAVQHPEASGFELLDMLMLRDKVAVQTETLEPDEKQQLATADRQLILNAGIICKELASVTDFPYERNQRNPTAKEWWWFLDILATAPVPAVHGDVTMAALS
ncbi:MAG: hypothetical protein R2867_47620 [Caldilineaceae bacterium]